MILLDTCALIWLANGDPMSPESLVAIREAAANGMVLVSSVSAWEVGMLDAKVGAGVRFRPAARDWFAALLARPGVRLVPLQPEVAIDAASLPGEIHGDPADRLLISQARHSKAPLVTRDGKIVSYATQGHVSVIAC